jgi:hypothetical protein
LVFVVDVGSAKRLLASAQARCPSPAVKAPRLRLRNGMPSKQSFQIAERTRLDYARDHIEPWKKWGPYLTERQWGTVREDYSENGDAWNYFSHDHARSRAYRWGEDGLGGISDDRQILCFALSMWNGHCSILKERLYGLTNTEGNHGEDVKEYYFYLDSTPTHSYMKYLYKYPQRPFPYVELIENNRNRSRADFEYELIDTGVFGDDRYYDVFVEYAKKSAEDIHIKISVVNRGPDLATIDLLPTMWFRNTWSWMEGSSKPLIKDDSTDNHAVAQACHTDCELQESISQYYLYCDKVVPLLFTDNETNNAKLFGTPNTSVYCKDGINEYIVHRHKEAINPDLTGTKVAAHYRLTIPPGATEIVKLRLRASSVADPFDEFDETFKHRIEEADEFYDELTPETLKGDLPENVDRRRMMRGALSGMLWGKQYFYYDVDLWLREHNVSPWSPSERRRKVRNSSWFHMHNDDIISMPDKWEYPWYAAWDLAFHMIPLILIDPDFAKSQLDLMLRNAYLHPNGQIPAYEWNFGDVNPPVHAYATYHTYLFDRARRDGHGDIDFLRYAFSKLLVNFTWWMNRKDPRGQNVFDGGFLGLDNIGVFDRSAALPMGGVLEQADGTAWMVFFSQQMLNIAIELAQHDPLYEEFAVKFFKHTLWIAAAMDRLGLHRDELWDEKDGFFYDVLRLPNGQAMRLPVRSLVGLLPLCSVVVFEENTWNRIPTFKATALKFVERHAELCANIHLPNLKGHRGRRMLSVCDETKMRLIFRRLFDESEFLSPYGIRSLSKAHMDKPFVFKYGQEEFKVEYVPGESNSGMFGGNSNWRGPIWFPMNQMIIRALLNYYCYFGKDFKVEYPTGSGKELNLYEICQDIMDRLTKIFLQDENGRRPVYGGTEKFQSDPHWKDLILFYEYFHGDNGAGLGASHQTGWTGLVGQILWLRSLMTEDFWLQEAPLKEIAKIAASR